MKLIKPSFTIIEQQAGLEGIYKIIEQAGRTCYKSEDRITENSAKEFVDRMIKSGHGAMLEHGTVYLDVPNSAGDYNLVPFFASNPYSRVVIEPLNDRVHNYITTNFRVIVENFAEEYIPDVLQYICKPTEYHDKRACVRFICDRGILAEFTRHRVFSFSAESTRYNNYSKDKFNNELTFIEPLWYNPQYSMISENLTPDAIFDNSCITAERNYKYLIKHGWKPQQARAVLPNALKTELVMTGFVSDWKHFFDLRCDSAAHPQARELAIPLKEEFIKRGYI